MDKNWLQNEQEGIHRRTFLAMMGVGGTALAGLTLAAKRAAAEAIKIQEMKKGEDVFAYIKRIKGKFDQTLYQQVIGAANDFKEGDLTIGVGAKDEATRKIARELLANTKIKDLHEHPLFVDDLQKLIWKTTDQAQYEKGQRLDHGGAEGIPPDQIRIGHKRNHEWPDQRHHRLRSEIDDQ